ncbi:MAG: XRE family transcriptional regulator [Nitrospinae bacterium]|nr:XRE family transcriptional regulator [Nitrospinota bacterium]MBF0633983.1 XRE family transcriptional regulator [Nitrospinota bacterium]
MEKSSGNVFLDLGFPKEEAENLRIRSRLMIEVKCLIEREKLTQAKAAKLFGVTQPRISDLKRGKIDVFSVDMLIKMLARAGLSVNVRVIKPKAA